MCPNEKISASLLKVAYVFQGYLPESMFDRILTGPIVPEEVSRRGRRPKNPLAKVAAAAALPNPAASALGLTPLLTNGILSGMDLTSLQALQQNLQSLQSLQLSTGLMGLPSDASNLAASNLAAMFPMMLSGVAGLPNLLGMSSLLGKPSEEGAGRSEKTKGNSSGGAGEPSSSKAPPHTSDTKGERTENTAPSSTSSSSSTVPNTSATSAASSHQLSLNPLLLSSMLYPGMLLTPGLNLPVSATQPQSSNSDANFSTPPPSAFSQSSAQETEQPVAAKDGEDDDELEEALEEEESAEQKENSGPEGSGKAESSSSSESGSSSSSSDGSDSSDED